MAAKITIRRANASDHNYLVDNFARSYRHSGYANGTSTEVLRRLIEPLLSLWTCDVATPAADPSFVLGWIVYLNPTTVGWVHVRPDMRRKGIAQQLLDRAHVAKGEIAAPFLPTKLEGAAGPFSTIAKDHGYVLRFRPYMPLMAALDVQRALAEVVAS